MPLFAYQYTLHFLGDLLCVLPRLRIHVDVDVASFADDLAKFIRAQYDLTAGAIAEALESGGGAEDSRVGEHNRIVVCFTIPVDTHFGIVSATDFIPSVWPSQPTGYVYGEPLAAQAIRGGNYWPQRYLEKRNEIVDNGNVVYDAVFAGDSITHRWERKGGEGRELFLKLREEYKLLDLGYGGDRVEHLVWRFENGELDGYKTKLFMLMIGTNNREGCKGGEEWRDIVHGIRRALDLIAAKHPEAKTLLLPIFPRGKDASDPFRMRNDKVNAAIKAFADGEKVVWLDFTQKFLDEKGDTKWCMNDRLHPNEKGYDIWWEAIKPFIDEARKQRKEEDALVGDREGAKAPRG